MRTLAQPHTIFLHAHISQIAYALHRTPQDPPIPYDVSIEIMMYLVPKLGLKNGLKNYLKRLCIHHVIVQISDQILEA